MFNRTGFAGLAAGILLACGTWTLAQTTSSELTLSPKYLDETPATPQGATTEQAPAPRRPLMGLLDKAGLAAPLDKASINIYGFIEGSYTYNLTAPSGGFNNFRVFDIYKNKGVLDQFDTTIERTVDASKKQWDVGFRLETIWGSDASLIHSNGLFDWYDTPQDPQNQWDLNQAYGDVAVPIGNGLRVRAGKYVTLLGAETINPTTDTVFSRSFLFGFAIPFTQTGVMGTYGLNDNWSTTLGIFRGWEQSVDDNNGTISYNGSLGYTSTDKKWALTGNVVTGPEQPDNNSNYRTVLDLVATFTPDPDGPWSFIANGDYGWEPNVPDVGDSRWYGIAGYAGYKLNNMFTINTRGEWFRDEEGARTGLATNFYEATLGLAIHPFPTNDLGSNLVLRPEIRYDYSDDDAFDDFTANDQATVAIEAIFTY